MANANRAPRPLIEGTGAKPDAVSPDTLLTTGAAAVLLGLSPRTLESLRVRGGGPSYFQVTPRAVRYRRGDLEAWLQARRRSSTADPGPDEDAG